MPENWLNALSLPGNPDVRESALDLSEVVRLNHPSEVSPDIRDSLTVSEANVKRLVLVKRHGDRESSCLIVVVVGES